MLDATSPVLSVSPVVLPAPGRRHPLQLRLSVPVGGTDLPVIVFSHGFGSSMDAYAPLAAFWAARGFAVLQPTFLDSRTLSVNPSATHSEALQAYLHNPDKLAMWRYRVEDVTRILDQLDLIGGAIPAWKGRFDQSRIAAVGHSFGAQTTAMLLGARVIGNDGCLLESFQDARVKAGVLLSAGGRGGDSLSPFAIQHFPHLNQSYAPMTTPALVIAGDADRSPLTVLGPEWFTDAYRLSPGANWLVSLFGGEHMLGGISGSLVTETTDENPQRVAAVQRLTTAYLRSALFAGDPSWAWASAAFTADPKPHGRIEGKSVG